MDKEMFGGVDYLVRVTKTPKKKKVIEVKVTIKDSDEEPSQATLAKILGKNPSQIGRVTRVVK